MVVLDFGDFVKIIYQFYPCQFSQLQSLAEGDTDPDNYNINHLHTIKRIMKKNNNTPFNFDSTIALIEELIV